MANAEAHLALGEWEKASELIWGGVCMELQAAAVLRKKHLGTHFQMVDFTRQLTQASQEPYWKDEFSELNNLHVNFYNLTLDELQVRDLVGRGLAYVGKLRELETRLT